jgi:hypothetical protein
MKKISVVGNDCELSGRGSFPPADQQRPYLPPHLALGAESPVRSSEWLGV